MKTFIQINGVKGEAKEKDHKEWIEATEFHHGVARRHAGGPTSLEGHGSGLPEGRDFVFTKMLDKSSPALNVYCCKNKKIDKVKIEVVTMDNEKKNKTLTITLEEANITSVQISGSSGGEMGRPIETVTVAFKKIRWEYIPSGESSGPNGEYDFGGH